MIASNSLTFSSQTAHINNQRLRAWMTPVTNFFLGIADPPNLAI
jgi:hypothetical protein